MASFAHVHENRRRSEALLAARMRPRSLDEFFGQQDILGPEQAVSEEDILFVEDVFQTLN